MSKPSSSPNTDQSPPRICVGEITTTHGVKGLVKIRSFAEDERLCEGVLFTSESDDKTLIIALKNPMNKVWLAEVEGYADKTAAEALRGTKLYIERTRLPETSEGEFYIVDLIGLPVESPDGEKIGKVISADNFGAGDLLEIKPTGGQSFYLPFNNDTIPDITDDKIVVIIPEGLLD